MLVQNLFIIIVKLVKKININVIKNKFKFFLSLMKIIIYGHKKSKF